MFWKNLAAMFSPVKIKGDVSRHRLYATRYEDLCM